MGGVSLCRSRCRMYWAMSFLHLFLQVRPVRPSISLEMMRHEVPWFRILTNRASSSSLVHFRSRSEMRGSRTSLYRFEHWSSVRPGINLAIWCHTPPCVSKARSRISSSALVHLPRFRLGSKEWNHRFLQSLFVRPARCAEI